MAGGPDGSNFQRVAEQYQKILARSGIDLKIEPSHGSADNLAVMDEQTVDVALVQAGVTRKDGTDHIVWLGQIGRASGGYNCGHVVEVSVVSSSLKTQSIHFPLYVTTI